MYNLLYKFKGIEVKVSPTSVPFYGMEHDALCSSAEFITEVVNIVESLISSLNFSLFATHYGIVIALFDM